jgi:hypothetical protein
LLLLDQQLLNPPALGVIFRLKQQFPETPDVFAPDEAFHGRPLADRPPRCDRATQGAQAAVTAITKWPIPPGVAGAWVEDPFS